eukprot:6207342-Pleurochrysis_carterae.AAC.3
MYMTALIARFRRTKAYPKASRLRNFRMSYVASQKTSARSSKIGLTSASGRLAPTLTAIRDLLTDWDAREYEVTDSSKPGRAFLAKRNRSKNTTDDKRGRKLNNPKRQDKPNTFDKEWSPKWGRYRHCGGKHSHRDCPRNPKKTENKALTDTHLQPVNRNACRTTPAPAPPSSLRLEAPPCLSQLHWKDAPCARATLSSAGIQLRRSAALTR